MPKKEHFLLFNSPIFSFEMNLAFLKTSTYQIKNTYSYRYKQPLQGICKYIWTTLEIPRHTLYYFSHLKMQLQVVINKLKGNLCSIHLIFTGNFITLVLIG